MKLNKYQKYDAYLFNRGRDTRQKSLDHEIKDAATYKEYAVMDSVRLNKYSNHDAFLFDKKYEVTRSMKLNKYPKYDAYLLDRASDIRQNHWTM